MKKEKIDIDFKILTKDNFSVEQWQEFYDSLDKEKQTWDIDRQRIPTLKEYFQFKLSIHPKVNANEETPEYSRTLGAWCNDTNKLVGTFDSYFIYDNDFIKKGIEMFLHSYVIKEEYQQNGLAKVGLEYYIKHISEYYFLNNPSPDKITQIKHIARIHKNNIGSVKLAESLGFTKGNLLKDDRYNYILDYHNEKKDFN